MKKKTPGGAHPDLLLYVGVIHILSFLLNCMQNYCKEFRCNPVLDMAVSMSSFFGPTKGQSDHQLAGGG